MQHLLIPNQSLQTIIDGVKEKGFKEIISAPVIGVEKDNISSSQDSSSKSSSSTSKVLSQSRINTSGVADPRIAARAAILTSNGSSSTDSDSKRRKLNSDKLNNDKVVGTMKTPASMEENIKTPASLDESLALLNALSNLYIKDLYLCCLPRCLLIKSFNAKFSMKKF